MQNAPYLVFALLEEKETPLPNLKIFQYFTLGRMVATVAVFFIAWLVNRYLSKGLEAVATRGTRVRFLAGQVQPVMRIVVWFAALLISFELLAPSRETFLAAVGSVAIAIGLGLQDLIKNLVGGLVILADRPYQIGDSVKIDEACGEIEDIGLRSTRLLTPEEVRVTIPNSMILEAQVFNASGGVPHCEVLTELYLPIAVDSDEVLRIAHEAAYTCPYLYTEKPVSVLLNDGFSEGPYQHVRIKAYVCDHRFEQLMQTDITLRAKRQFLRHGLLAQWANEEVMAHRAGV